MRAIITAFLMFSMTIPQTNAQIDKKQVASDLATAIDQAIERHKGEDSELRRKVIIRLIECGLVRGLLSGPMSAVASEIFIDVSKVVATGKLRLAEYKELVDVARKESTEMKKRGDQKEIFLLLRSCLTFGDVKNIDTAVAELVY